MLTHEVNNSGRRLDNKLMGFTPESAEGFDVEPWLPWNYLALRGLIAKWRCIRSAIFFGLFIGKPPDWVLTLKLHYEMVQITRRKHSDARRLDLCRKQVQP